MATDPALSDRDARLRAPAEADAALPANRELSDEELDKVSGGVFGIGAAIQKGHVLNQLQSNILRTQTEVADGVSKFR